MSRGLYVAGVGASAGGLEALGLLFSRLPRTGRIAYVVAQHMAHNAHTDLVVRLLSRDAELPVVLGTQGMKLLADRIHVIPAGFDGVVEHGALLLRPPGPDSLSTPSVNVLFSSIARHSGPRAIGILLSGAGTDGRTGCRELRSRGGLTLAQEPSEARFSGMPEAAVREGVIDRVLTSEAIVQALTALCPALLPPAGPGPAPARPCHPVEEEVASPSEHLELSYLLPLVLEATGIDFRRYKEETLVRRLEKRKASLGLPRAEEYLAYVRRHPQELQVLQHQFLVSVSSFFRDRPSFRRLEQALGEWLDQQEGLETLKVWVPGCATGEEAWSLAITLRHLLEARPAPPRLEMLCTDLNPEAVEIARRGLYRPASFREMEPELQSRYFTPKGVQFEVGATLREGLHFEQRDVLLGPSMEGLALVSCRNFLIYLKRSLQDRLLASLYPAMLPNSLLFLSQAETLGFESVQKFAPLDAHHRIYRKRG